MSDVTVSLPLSSSHNHRMIAYCANKLMVKKTAVFSVWHL